MSKYIGGFAGDEMAPVSRLVVEAVIRDNKQYGTVRERSVTCHRILRNGGVIADGSGFCVRYANLRCNRSLKGLSWNRRLTLTKRGD